MSSSGEVSAKDHPSKPTLSIGFDENGIPNGDAYVQTADHPRPRKVPRLNKALDQASQSIPEPPKTEPIFNTTLDLYKKAVDDPTSLTEEDRLEILGWVSEDVADERCRKACGVKWRELVAIAAERPEELTHDQALFVQTGRNQSYGDGDAELETLVSKMQQPAHIRELWRSAKKASYPSDFTIAETNAMSASQRLQQSKRKNLSHLSEDHTTNIRQSTLIPWIERLTSSSKPHWGLICFRTAFNDEEAWQKYKEHIINSSRMGLSACPGTDYIMSKWKIKFIEDEEGLDGLDVLGLCIYYHQDPHSLAQTALSSGLRSDTFLYADEHAIASLNDTPAEATQTGTDPETNTSHPVSGYINAVDASYDICETYPHDFKGELKVHPAHIATTFCQKLIPREEEGAYKEAEKSEERWRVYMMDWETMYRLANGKEGGEAGVYPPNWTHNQNVKRWVGPGRSAVQAVYDEEGAV